MLPGMADSTGALLSDQEQGAGAAGAASTSDRIRATMDSPPPAPPPPAATLAADPAAPGHLAAGLARMGARADLFGFAITPRRRVVGLRMLKRVLRRLQAQTFAWQSEFNVSATEVLAEVVAQESAGRRALQAQAQALTAAQAQIGDLESRLAGLRSHNTSLAERVDRQQVALDALSGDESAPELDYVVLQAAFRGDEEEIAERQLRYVSCFQGAQDVLDIGCGRGEFLRLLGDAGIRARGVDTDLDMVRLCRSKGLTVSHGDGITLLAVTDDGSLGGVFAAQVVEHLPPARILALLQAAHRTLRSGGVLVLETINPGSVVALANFYLDFTHVKPVHPLALEWLAESLGFTDCELVYLSPVEGGPRLRELPDGIGDAEAVQDFNHAVAATNEVLYGPRDYALIARRP